MSVVGTVVANLVANTEPFSRGIKKADSEMARLTKSVRGLQSAAKFGFGILAGSSITKFIKGTLREATEQGSELQKALGMQGVNAAQQLSESIGKVKLGLQQSVLTVLKEFISALERAARLAESIGDRIGGGLVGEQKAVANERRDFPLNLLKPEDELARLIRQRQRIERALLRENAPGFETKGEFQNRFELGQAQIATINKEIEFLEKNLNRIKFNNALMSIADDAKNLAGAFGADWDRVWRRFIDGNRELRRQQVARGIVGAGRGVANSLGAGTFGGGVLGAFEQFGNFARGTARDAFRGVQRAPAFERGARAVNHLARAFQEFQRRIDELSSHAREASRGSFGAFVEDIAALRHARTNRDITAREFGFGALGAAKRLKDSLGLDDNATTGLAVKGSQEFFRALNQRPEPTIKELVQIAKKQDDKLRRLASEIGKEIKNALTPEEVRF